MGLVGSGTNNARLAGLLRNLAQFYHKEPQDLFMVRLAQVAPWNAQQEVFGCNIVLEHRQDYLLVCRVLLTSERGP